MRAQFIRGLDPKDAMGTGQPDERFAQFMIEKEEQLKLRGGARPIWAWWESYSGDFWEDIHVTNLFDKGLSIYDIWKQAYFLDQKRCLIQKGVIEKLLTLKKIPKDIDNWLWPGPNKRRVTESLKFQRGIDPKDAMGIGDPKQRAKEKYYPLFLNAFEDLHRQYKLNPRSLRQTIITGSGDPRDNLVHHIEISYKGTERSLWNDKFVVNTYVLGYNLVKQRYYVAVEVLDNAPTSINFFDDFNMACQQLKYLIDQVEVEK